MDYKLRSLIVGIIIGIILGIITHILGKTEYFYIRIIGVVIGFMVLSIILTGKIF